MIGGIFETIGKTLGIGQEKYFLELDDAADAGVEKIKKSATKAAQSAVETAKDVSADVVEKAQDLVGDASESAESTAKSAANKAKAATKQAAGKTAKKAKKTDKKQATKQAVKAEKADALEKKPTFGKKSSEQPSLATGDAPDVDESQAQPTAPVVKDPEELIVAAIAATAAGKKVDSKGNVVEAPVSFAEEYLMPRTGGRRRPGPSFAGFKDMAKEVNPRLKG